MYKYRGRYGAGDDSLNRADYSNYRVRQAGHLNLIKYDEVMATNNHCRRQERLSVLQAIDGVYSCRAIWDCCPICYTKPRKNKETTHMAYKQFVHDIRPYHDLATLQQQVPLNPYKCFVSFFSTSISASLLNSYIHHPETG